MRHSLRRSGGEARMTNDAAVEVLSIELPATMVDVSSHDGHVFDLGAGLQVRAVPFSAGPPDVLSVPVTRLSIKTQSFVFPTPAATGGDLRSGSWHGQETVPQHTETVPQHSATPDSRVPSPESRAPTRSVTRLKPPGDVVKLEDRLLYVLQPSLETLLADSSLEFPFVPFPVSVRGSRFSVSPRRRCARR